MLRQGSFEQRRYVHSCFWQCSFQLLTPVGHITCRAVAVDHLHRGLACVGQLMKLSGRYHDCLSCRHLLPFSSKAHLATTLNDEVDLFLFLVVPVNLSTFLLNLHHPHREILCLTGGCSTVDVP